ncbi:hypothetical protein PVAG01_11052 [Phlyctema vagabunda]|uniref:Uncharacterized protein n=1 Tax=Phlyctema vagabunda TaxID=108571 RepID=A0ABR4P425_9HELO
MFSALSNFVNDIALGPQTRQVKQYLAKATYESVPEDLGKVLSSQLTGFRERELLHTAFKNCSIEDSSGQKYWNEDSFRRHIKGTQSAATLSETEIQLLWRSFYFYAYHPFPRDVRDGKIDFDAFQRAAQLLIFQCNDLLGTRELEWFWRNDAVFFQNASFERIFRSIAVEKTAGQSSKPNYMNSSVSDAMDVLIMVGPQFMHAAPTPEQLEIVARTLFATKASLQTEIKRQDMKTLIVLLLRLELQKEKWATLYNFGEIVDSSPIVEELAEALVNSLIGNSSEEDTASEQIVHAMNLVPNLQLRFYQLWSVLFQPSIANMDKSRPTSVNCSGAISLFAPQIKMESHYHERGFEQDERFVLQLQAAGSEDIGDRLAQALLNDSAFVVLIRGDDPAGSRRVIFGAYFPSTKGGEKSRSDTSHLLFQLQPEFRLLEWMKTGVSPAELIQINGHIVSLGRAVTPSPDSMGEHSAGLQIDASNNVATLTSGDGKWYKDINGKGCNNLSCEATAKKNSVDIYRVN